ncbi:unnamed protein product, partial [Protopolystoma xenopodis]
PAQFDFVSRRLDNAIAPSQPQTLQTGRQVGTSNFRLHEAMSALALDGGTEALKLKNKRMPKAEVGCQGLNSLRTHLPSLRQLPGLGPLYNSLLLADFSQRVAQLSG